MSTEQQPIATLTFNFYKDLGLATKIDFDENNLRTLNEANLIPIFMAKATQSVVSDILEGGSLGSLVAHQVAAALRIHSDDE